MIRNFQLRQGPPWSTRVQLNRAGGPWQVALLEKKSATELQRAVVGSLGLRSRCRPGQTCARQSSPYEGDGCLHEMREVWHQQSG